MQDLIERLEKATGPERFLDCEIALAVGYRERGGMWRRPDMDNSDPPLASCPAFTRSVDAALTLVPFGLAWTLGQNVHHRYWQACVNGLDAEGAPKSVGFSGHRDLKSPALALCIAALRARADNHLQ